MLEKILVPLDGSKLGELALVYAKELAVAVNPEVHLLSTCERLDGDYRHMCDVYIDQRAAEFRKELEVIGCKAAVKTLVIDGSAAEEILKYADDKRVGLIIMVSHGRSGLMPWAVGGTADKVAQRALQPVLLIHATAAMLKRKPRNVFRRILVPLDGSPMSEAVLPGVAEIASALRCEVILLRVVEPVQRVHTVGGPDHFLVDEQRVENLMQEATIYLEEVKKKLTDCKGTVRYEMRVGDIAREILRVTSEARVKIVAMSSHGKSGLNQWMLGSISSKVLHAGKITMLMVKPAKAG